MDDFNTYRDKWICPTDRELSLRAKLKMGWSVKTNDFNTYNKLNHQQIKDGEQETILKIIKKAEQLEKIEQERVGRLVERIENMKQNAIGNGLTQCILCADEFGLLSATPQHCADCNKAVCTKCGVDTFGFNKEAYWMCKICAETREMWKKSGAWFFKSLPKYTLPLKKKEIVKYSLKMQTDSSRIFYSWPTSKGQERDSLGKDSTESSDEEIKTGPKPISYIKKSINTHKKNSFGENTIPQNEANRSSENLPCTQRAYEVETVESIQGAATSRPYFSQASFQQEPKKLSAENITKN